MERVRINSIDEAISKDAINSMCGNFGIEVGMEGEVTSRVPDLGWTYVRLDKDVERGKSDLITAFLDSEVETMEV